LDCSLKSLNIFFGCQVEQTWMCGCGLVSKNQTTSNFQVDPALKHGVNLSTKQPNMISGRGFKASFLKTNAADAETHDGL
jgi:hypothetical protein